MAENVENNGCSQRDNAEHEGYAKASRSFNRIWKERDSAQPRLLEAILYKDNFNRAYKSSRILFSKCLMTIYLYFFLLDNRVYSSCNNVMTVSCNSVRNFSN